MLSRSACFSSLLDILSILKDSESIFPSIVDKLFCIAASICFSSGSASASGEPARGAGASICSSCFIGFWLIELELRLISVTFAHDGMKGRGTRCVCNSATVRSKEGNYRCAAVWARPVFPHTGRLQRQQQRPAAALGFRLLVLGHSTSCPLFRRPCGGLLGHTEAAVTGALLTLQQVAVVLPQGEVQSRRSPRCPGTSLPTCSGSLVHSGSDKTPPSLVSTATRPRVL
ncbi:hypothetical protein NDU88_003932 [Pleurodeles waltl]|uniref:Uncharacterized protein n=1 Tax=Pleurodeles waltl TaxID=8319 RepID=A0AAV7KZW4_PLEWA|nr:hypothetical protein NDU88_003932 [Pleurodeles waltl]